MEFILELFARGDLSLSEIANQAGCSMLELARVMAQPEQMMQLQELAALGAMHRDLQLGQHKANAMVKLAQLSASLKVSDVDESRAAETMRKACVDLLKLPSEMLKLQAAGDPSGVSIPEEPQEVTPWTEDQILSALERMSQQDDEISPSRRVGSTHHDEPGNERNSLRSEIDSTRSCNPDCPCNSVGGTQPARGGAGNSGDSGGLGTPDVGLESEFQSCQVEGQVGREPQDSRHAQYDHPP